MSTDQPGRITLVFSTALPNSYCFSITVSAGSAVISSGPKSQQGVMAVYSSDDKLEGHLDRIDGLRVLGWAWQSNLADDSTSVDLYVDDIHVGSVTASSYRPDLEKAGKGNGRHAFELRLPESCFDGETHSVRVCYRGTNVDLYGSPRTVRFGQKAGLARVGTALDEHIQGSEDERAWPGEPSKDPPKVSVVIPCYNLGPYLDQAVQSVLNQTIQDFEIIIIDDGSTDPATCHLFASYRRPKTRILRTSNQGLAKARNLGIAEAKGVYICCLNVDVLPEPAFLERSVQMLDSDPSSAFVSCWLKGSEGSAFDWNPSACEFPCLLVENGVRTPTLMRRDTVWQLGGFDAQMPGCEDWDLAINLVDRGFCGTIIPEYLFGCRTREAATRVEQAGSDDRGYDMRFIVEKHAGIYRKHLPEVLAEIEKRTREPHGTVEPDHRRETAQIRFLEDTLSLVLSSRSWRSMRPVRRGVSRAKSFFSMRPAVADKPKLSVVLTCRDQGRDLPMALHSVKEQLCPSDEIIIVDDGSKDLVTLQVLDWYRESGFKVIQSAGPGPVSARAAGLNHCRGEIWFALGAEQFVQSSYLRTAIDILESHQDLAFVVCGLYDERTGFSWIPDSANLQHLIACPHVPFPFVRSDRLAAVGGYDTNFKVAAQADWELMLRLASSGGKGHLIHQAQVIDRRPNRSAENVEIIKPVLEKQRALFDSHWKEALLGFENQRRRLEAKLTDEALPDGALAANINWGDLRRLDPISAVWGLDRGQPIDRYYIAHFLDGHRNDIQGHVLEVKDSGYTRAYGSGVSEVDVVDIAANNPAATFVCDLSSCGSLPQNRYDCFIITQTIHIIYEIRNVIDNAFHALKPGGILLATLPCVSRIDYESGLEQDQWRFTAASARRLFEEIFGVAQVEVQSHGNILACSGFLMGLCAADLTAEELNHRDPYFPLLITVRAVKARTESFTTVGRALTRCSDRALILVYHRIDRPIQDRWGLCVSPENFAAHMRCLRRSFQPVRLAEVTAMIAEGRIKQGSVAVTFDDGYRDNLMTALPIMRESKTPGTFFISGDGASEEASFWWEVLDNCMATMELNSGDAGALHKRLMVADAAERKQILADLPSSRRDLPARLSRDEIQSLAQEPLADIGAHGWSHRVLAPLSIDDQREEILQNAQSLMDLTGLGISHFAYPFGGSVTAELKRVLREAGITYACTVESVAVTGDCDPLAIPRLEVGDWDAKQFEERLTSLLHGD
jgi:glycosyltransferase involved in cell wall biosynthesis/peptidoglycan/xylan/chitin deacetylase (PgdA/CDA1 family)